MFHKTEQWLILMESINGECPASQEKSRNTAAYFIQFGKSSRMEHGNMSGTREQQARHMRPSTCHPDEGEISGLSVIPTKEESQVSVNPTKGDLRLSSVIPTKEGSQGNAFL